jgi:hypothetical protein
MVKGAVYYESENFRVRSRFKRDDTVDFVIERPRGKKGQSVLDSFPIAVKAEFIARHCDENFDGRYHAEARKAAKKRYQEVLESLDRKAGR